MGIRFRKTKTIGGVRLTATKSGLGVSTGVGPARIGIGADGKTGVSGSVPGTGISATHVIGGAAPAEPTAAPAAQVTTDGGPELYTLLAAEGPLTFADIQARLEWSSWQLAKAQTALGRKVKASGLGKGRTLAVR